MNCRIATRTWRNDVQGAVDRGPVPDGDPDRVGVRGEDGGAQRPRDRDVGTVLHLDEGGPRGRERQRRGERRGRQHPHLVRGGLHREPEMFIRSRIKYSEG